MLGSFADNRRARNVHSVRIVKKSLCVKIRYFKNAFSALLCACYHFIFAVVRVVGKVAYVGNVHYMVYVKTRSAQGTDQYVVKHIGA
jgi:hypothetical protein